MTQVLKIYIIVPIFRFDPAEYQVSEDSGAVSITVSLLGGDLGEFTVTLTATTDDNNTMATAIGNISI